MSDAKNWTQEESETYRQLAAIAVPSRAEQIATLLTLIPFAQDAEFKVVELASGEGRLAYAILDAFPHATVLALDFEASMRQEATTRLSEFAERATVDAFDMKKSDWYSLMSGADVVLSSLCIHHLTGGGKQALFSAVHEHLSEHGSFLIADLVLPQRPQSNALFEATWDASTRQASLELTGDTQVYQLFDDENWNYYRLPDDFDKPSPLFHQLQWLEKAGFEDVDCFWMQAGHAIYGGYQADAGENHLAYEKAMKSASRAIK